MTQPSNICQLLAARAQTQGDALALRYLEQGDLRCVQELSYAQLDAGARAVAQQLFACGLAGQRVLIVSGAKPSIVRSLMGAMLAGCVPVVAKSPSKHYLQALAGICTSARPGALIATGVQLEQFRRRAKQLGLSGHTQYLDVDTLGQTGSQKTKALPKIGAEDLAFLQFSSGSTRAPRGIAVRHENLWANLARQQAALGHPPRAALVSWLPLHHDMGLVGQLLWGLYVNAPVTLLEPLHFFESPFRWLEAISKLKAHTAGGPNFAYEACLRKISADQVQQLDLRGWKIAFSGAEPVRMATMQRFAAHLEPAGFSMHSFMPSYGLAESCVFVSAGVKGQPRELWLDRQALAQGQVKMSSSGRSEAVSVVSCGKATMGDELSIRDPQTQAPCLGHQVGEIWVRGPSVCRGYVGGEPSEAMHYDPAAKMATLRTGDLGFVHDGELYVTGRLKDLIICRGQNIYPQDLEAQIEQGPWQDKLTLCVAVEHADTHEVQPWIVAELARHVTRDPAQLDALARQMRAQVGRETGVDLGGVALVGPAQIPRTSSGKVQRSTTAQRFAKGQLRVVHRRAFSATEPSSGEGADLMQLTRRFVQARAGDQSLEGQSAFELGLGSLDCAMLAEKLHLAGARDVELLSLMAAPDLGAFVSGLCVAAGSAGVNAQRGQDPEQQAPTPCEDLYVASPGQRAMWAVHHTAQDPSVYNVHLVLDLPAGHAAQGFKQAFAKLLHRHAVLRTRLISKSDAGDKGNTLWAQVQPADQVCLDWSEISCEDEASQALAIRSALHKAFDLAKDLPIRLVLVRDAKQRSQRLVWVMHHIAVDFWSLVVLVQELRALLSGQELAPLQASYAQWERISAKARADHELGDWSYWRKQLEEPLPAAPLALDHRAPQGAVQGRVHLCDVPVQVQQALGEIARDCGVSRYTIYLALFGLLLARRSGQSNVVVGTPITGRDQGRWQELVGYFVNPAALVLSLGDDPGQTLRAYLGAVGACVQDAMSHRRLPFAQIVEKLAPKRGGRRWPFYQVAFTYQASHDPRLDELSVLALQDPRARVQMNDALQPAHAGGGQTEPGESFALRHAHMQERVENFDLKLVMAKGAQGEVAAFLYDTQVLDPSSVEALAQDWSYLAHAMACAGSDARLDDLVLPAGPVQPFVAPALDEGAHLATRWAHLVQAHPQRRLCQGGDQRPLCVKDLHRHSTALAQQMALAGLGRGDRCALELEMSPRFVAAALACARLGAAYLPLDPRDPQKRRDALVRGVGAKLRVVPACDEGGLCREGKVPVLAVPFLHNLDAPSSPELASLTLPSGDEVAYLVYTSGSTGRPKAVEVSHRALLGLVQWHGQTHLPRAYSGEPPGCALTARVSFDASVWELWGNLLGGAELCFPPREVVQDPQRLMPWLQAQRIDQLFLPTALLEACLAQGWPTQLARLRVLTGGDRLGALVSTDPAQMPSIINHYGPCEAAVVATYHRVDTARSGPPPIGEALPQVWAQLLREDLTPAPKASTGQLYLSGAALAQGYAEDPRRSAQLFLPNPYGPPGSRMYATGDRARLDAQGRFHFEGRSDDQVQVRGARVELGEIESWLGEQPNVRSAKVLARRDDRGVAGLCAFVQGRLLQDLGTAQRDQVQEWRSLYEKTYAQLPDQGGQTRDDGDLVGWEHSDRPGAIDPEHMWEMVDDTVAAILACKPKVLLEIGVGSGLLAKALAPQVKRYVACDLSPSAVAHVSAWAKSQGHAHLEVFVSAAHECLSDPALAGHLAHIDTVVLNSVLQYFPSSSYLSALMDGLLTALPNLAHVVVGDVRDAELLPIFQLHLAYAQASQQQSLGAIQTHAQRLARMDRELCVSLSWWHRCLAQYPGWELAAMPKRGRFVNELSRYRYDLRLRSPKAAAAETSSLASAATSYPDFAQLDPGYEGELASAYTYRDSRLHEPLALWQAMSSMRDEELSFCNKQSLDMSPTRARPQPLHELAQTLASRGRGLKVAYGFARAKGQVQLWIDKLDKNPWPPSLAPRVGTDLPAPLVHEPWQHAQLSALESELRDRLAEHFPAYMVPSRVVALEDWPRTSSGKLDSAALWRLVPQSQGAPPQDPTQALLCSVFAKVLGLASVGIDQNFFSLGGDSILAIEVASRVREQGFSLSSSQIFEHPKILELAPKLVALGEEDSKMDACAVAAPLTAMQQGLWIEQGQGAYHESVELVLEGAIDEDALQQAWRELLIRHDALRCAFVWTSEGGQQRVALADELVLDWDLSLDASALQAQARAPLDHARAPVMRWRGVRTAKGLRLVWTHTHLVLDGWSVALVIAELLTRYTALAQGKPLALGPAPSFVAWARTQKEKPGAKAARYWRGMAARYRRAASQWPSAQASGTMHTLSHRVGLEPSAQLIALAKAKALTPSALVYTVWSWVWASACASDDAVVGVVHAGRDHAGSGGQDLSKMVGLCIQSYPLILRARPGQAWRELLAECAQSLVKAQGAAQGASLQDLARWLGAGRGGDLWGALVAVENYPRASVFDQPHAGLWLREVHHRGSTHYPVTVVITLGDQIDIKLSYDDARVQASAAISWLDAFVHGLHELARDVDAPASVPSCARWVTPKDSEAAASAASKDSIPHDLSPQDLAARIELLQTLWAKALDRARPSVDQDFFELGGDSIAAMTIVQALSQAGWQTSVQELMATRRIEALAPRLQRPDRALDAAKQPRAFAMFPIHHWWQAQQLAEPHHFNQALRLPLPDQLSLEQLTQALEHLAQHHAACRVNLVDDELVVGDCAAGRWPVRELILDAQDPARAKAQLQAASSEMQAGFCLHQGPLFAALYVQGGAGVQSSMIWAAHHLVVDAVSWRVLLHDFQQVCEALVKGQCPLLAPPTASLAQWSHALERFVPRAHKFRRYLESLPPAASAPLVPSADAGTWAQRRVSQFQLDPASTTALQSQGTRVYHASFQELLLAAFARAMHACFGREDLVVNLEGHGRYQDLVGPCVDRTVGWFTTLYPVGLQALPGSSWQEQVHRIKGQLRDVPDKGLGFGLLQARGEIAPSPAQLSWNYLGQIDARFRGASSMVGASEDLEAQLGPCHSPRNRCAHLIDLNLCLIDHRLAVHLAYGPGLDASRATQLLEGFADALQDLALACQGAKIQDKSRHDYELVQMSETDFSQILAQVNRQGEQGDV